MKLEQRVGSVYQIKNGMGESAVTNDIAQVSVAPFAVLYFKTPAELPLDWKTVGETGTQGSVYQKDD